MPIATGGGSDKKKTTGSSIVASKRKTVTKAGTGGVTKGGAGSSQTSGYSPADADKPTGLSPADKAAKKAAQAAKSAAKHAARRRAERVAARVESRRDTARAGGRGRVSEPDYVKMQGTTGASIVRSRRATVRAAGTGGITKRGAGSEAFSAARSAVSNKRGDNTSTVTRRTYEKGGSTFGGTTKPRESARVGGADFTRTPKATSGVGGIDPLSRTPDGQRVGGGFKEFSGGFHGAAAYFDTGGGGGGGGAAGGNPLGGGADFGGESLEEVLHGNKKKGRAKRSRRTE